MIDLAILAILVGIGSLIVYKVLKTALKVVLWCVSIVIAYIVIKFLLVGAL